MKEFVLASGNSHKADEFSELFDPEIILVKAAPEKLEVVEDGLSFQENAFKKAEGYYKKLKCPIVSDDSGLEVEALPGELGIHSARFGGEDLSSEEQVELLLEKLKEEENRKAYFVCVLCFYINPEEVYFFEGRSHGHISSSVQGSGGFGYDPVFIPENLDGKTSFAENPDWKMKNSHRSKACKMASQFFGR
ncbi:MAG: non-canonical purine NTP pyrophosphatase [Halobacteriovorax sp.]|nr:non-canonical purine NTP pyrophosphatase [Halobacteriovorax sp.]